MSKFTDALKGALTSKDSWKGADKAMHLAAGFLLSLIVGVLTSHPPVGFAAGVVVGAGKEIYDAANPDTHSPSIKDFVVTLVGALIGAYVSSYF